MNKKKQSNKKQYSKLNFKIITFYLIGILVFEFILLILIVGNIWNNNQFIDGVTLNDINTKKMEAKNIAVFETSQGTFKIELFLDKSPITAGNFKKLVEEGFYDQTRFHRIIKDFMIQGGDPLSKNTTLRGRWGTGGPGYSIKDEFIKGLSNKKGTIAMANSGPNSGGSQFFINVKDNTFLDWDKQPSQSKHPVFGKVIEGMDIVMKISNVKTKQADMPVDDIVITKVYME